MLKMKKIMSKIWVVDSKYHKRTFRTEKTFLDFIATARKNRYKVNYKVQIYQLVEQHDSSEVYLDSFLTQKERDEQLSVLLENNIEVQTLQKVNELINDYCSSIEKPNRNLKKYQHNISLMDSNFASFKKVVSDYDIRRAFLYDGPSSVEWYKTILFIHNFKFETEIRQGKNRVSVSKERIDNFQEAKKQLKSKK